MTNATLNKHVLVGTWHVIFYYVDVIVKELTPLAAPSWVPNKRGGGGEGGGGGGGDEQMGEGGLNIK